MVKFLKRSSSHELVVIHEFSHAYTPKKAQKTTYCPKGQSFVAPTARVFIYAYFFGRDSHELVIIHEFSHAYTPKKERPKWSFLFWRRRRRIAPRCKASSRRRFAFLFYLLFRSRLARTRGNSRVLTRLYAKKGAEDYILPQRAKHRRADGSRFYLCLLLRTRLARTRGNSRVLTRLYAKKGTTERSFLFWRRRRDSNSCYGFPILLP